MPQLRNVTVTRQAPAGIPAVVWQAQGNATIISPSILVSPNAAHPAPVGFFNNPASTYIITGNDNATSAAYTSPVVRVDPARTEIDRGIFAFH